ncbi:hypothetical protein SAMN05421871_11927, partial [Actinokineospora alba]
MPLPQVAGLAGTQGDALDNFALNVESSNYSTMYELTFFASSIVWALTSPFTAWMVPEFIAGARLAVAQIFALRDAATLAAKQVVEEAAEEVAQDALVQLHQKVEGNRHSVDWDSITLSAVAGAAAGGLMSGLRKLGEKFTPDFSKTVLFSGLTEGVTEGIVGVGVTGVTGGNLSDAWMGVVGGFNSGSLEHGANDAGDKIDDLVNGPKMPNMDALERPTSVTPSGPQGTTDGGDGPPTPITQDVESELPPGVDKPGTDTPGVDGPGSDTPGVHGPVTDTPGVDEPGSQTPGVDGPETDAPGVDGPGADAPGLDGLGTDVPLVVGAPSNIPAGAPQNKPPGHDPQGQDLPGRDRPAETGPHLEQLGVDQPAPHSILPHTPPPINGPVADGPRIEHPVIDVPVVDTPVIAGPRLDDQPLDGPRIEHPVIDVPVVDTPVIAGPRLDGQPLDGPRIEHPVVEGSRVDVPDGPIVEGQNSVDPGQVVGDPTVTPAPVPLTDTVTAPPVTVDSPLFNGVDPHAPSGLPGDAADPTSLAPQPIPTQTTDHTPTNQPPTQAGPQSVTSTPSGPFAQVTPPTIQPPGQVGPQSVTSTPSGPFAQVTPPTIQPPAQVGPQSVTSTPSGPFAQTTPQSIPHVDSALGGTEPTRSGDQAGQHVPSGQSDHGRLPLVRESGTPQGSALGDLGIQSPVGHNVDGPRVGHPGGPAGPVTVAPQTTSTPVNAQSGLPNPARGGTESVPSGDQAGAVSSGRSDLGRLPLEREFEVPRSPALGDVIPAPSVSDVPSPESVVPVEQAPAVLGRTDTPIADAGPVADTHVPGEPATDHSDVEVSDVEVSEVESVFDGDRSDVTDASDLGDVPVVPVQVPPVYGTPHGYPRGESLAAAPAQQGGRIHMAPGWPKPVRSAFEVRRGRRGVDTVVEVTVFVDLQPKGRQDVLVRQQVLREAQLAVDWYYNQPNLRLRNGDLLRFRIQPKSADDPLHHAVTIDADHEIDHLHWRPGMPSVTYAHEFGHMIGQPEEYAENQPKPDNNAKDNNAKDKNVEDKPKRLDISGTVMGRHTEIGPDGKPRLITDIKVPQRFVDVLARNLGIDDLTPTGHDTPLRQDNIVTPELPEGTPLPKAPP